MDLEEGDVVLCTVERIVGTTVFVSIHLNGKRIEGSIIFSEIAPGRIRNIRDYVVPKKKIVCKVLRITGGDRIELSFRRVNQEERKRVLAEFNQEKSYMSMLKSILGEKQAEESINKIVKKERLYDFFQESKSNPKMLDDVFSKKDAEKILEVLKAEKPKEKVVKKEFTLKTSHPEGILKIKEILKGDGEKRKKDIDIRYLSAGRYGLKLKSQDLKKSDQDLQDFLKEVEKKSKKYGMEFNLLKK